ncbi:MULTISPECIES: discoidin domain-containing protein [unclassified Luteococcus]|uniref:discoidin domain-containing protein n=1 Tax=unclassified Luteococcus TaxID=2639923 RepID=UPI00313AA2C5
MRNTKRAIALPVALALAAGALGAATSDTTARAGESPLLADIVIDKVGGLHRPFQPEVHDYAVATYASTQSLLICPKAIRGEVTIAGQPVDGDGCGRVPVALGINRVPIVVSHQGASDEYRVSILRRNTDFRGRSVIPGVKATAALQAPDHPAAAAVDGKRESYWRPEQNKAGKPGQAGVSEVVLTLPEKRWISKVTGWLELTTEKMWVNDLPQNYLTIQTSTDGRHWKTVAEKATLRQDSHIAPQDPNSGRYYWDWNNAVQAKYVRLTLGAGRQQVIDSFGVRELSVWGLPKGARPKRAPFTRQQPVRRADGSLGVNRANELAIRNNITVSTWTPNDQRAAMTPNNAEYDSLARPAAIFYGLDVGPDPDGLHNATEFMKNNPQAQWGIARAPRGDNWSKLADAGEPTDFLHPSMKPYRDRLVEVQLGDEGGYSDSEVAAFAKWFEFTKKQYPTALVHSNQFTAPSWATNAQSYVQRAKPDILSWDNYYWGGGKTFGSHGPTAAETVNHLLGATMWTAYREAAAKGLTGDGSQPILWGQYLDAFDSDYSQSQRAIVTNLSLASGAKWFGLFRLDLNRYDGSNMVGPDGEPLREWHEYAALFRQIRNLGNYLTPMTSDWVAVQPGQSGGPVMPVTNRTPSAWRMDSFARSQAANGNYGIKSVTARNVGTQNRGRPGDVVLGYFKPLPGLDTKLLRQRFGTTSPRAVMVVNGLTSHAKRPNTSYFPRIDDGQFWQTAQEISLDVDPQAGDLMRVDPETGRVSQVPIRDGKVTLRLGGGQAALLYWRKAMVQAELKAPSEPVQYTGSTQLSVTVNNPLTEKLTGVRVQAAQAKDWEVSVPSESVDLAPGQSHTFALTARNLRASGPTPLSVTLAGEDFTRQLTGTLTGTPCSTERIPATVLGASSEETAKEDGKAANAVDGKLNTQWHTDWSTTSPKLPHWIQLDLGSSQPICRLGYQGRQDMATGQGWVKDYEVYVSDQPIDPAKLPPAPTASGVFEAQLARQEVPVNATGRYVLLRGKSIWDGSQWMTAAEIQTTRSGPAPVPEG